VSGPLAIAGVSAVLQDVLVSGMNAMNLGGSLFGSASNDVAVSVGAPDQVAVTGTGAFSQLNLFLYNLTRNAGWANLELPSRDSRGDRVANPALGIDLYYLLTAYGTKDFDAETLLGGALQVLHDTPGLGRSEIRTVLTSGSAKLPKNVALSGLADQVELIKISPLPMTTEEIVRLWSAFQCNYRPSVAYLVTVVLLRSAAPSRPALPVRQRQLYATPFSPPTIDTVENVAGADVAIVPGATVRLRGANLNATGLTLLVGGLDLTAQLSLLTNDQLQFVLPAPGAWPAGLYAGTTSVQLKCPQLMGSPPVAHASIESNVASFDLAPLVTATAAAASVTLTFATPVAARQRVRLALLELNPPATRAPYQYAFDAPDGNGVVPPVPDTLSVSVPIAGVTSATYLVSASVDGVASPLTQSSSGAFNGPTVVI